MAPKHTDRQLKYGSDFYPAGCQIPSEECISYALSKIYYLDQPPNENLQNYNTFYHFLLNFEMSTFVKDMLCTSNTTAVPTHNLPQGKCPLKEGCRVNCHQDIQWGSGCQISMTNFLMFDTPTHSQINNSCLNIYP
jgi:hypothetical protein